MIIYAKSGKVISLGRVGDKDATVVRFDLSDWIGTYGAGQVIGTYVFNTTIIDVPSQAVSASNPYFDWTIHEEVTNNPGVGRFQFTFIVNEIHKVSTYYDTLVTTSVYYDNDYSEDYRSWLDTLNTLILELIKQKEGLESYIKLAHDWAIGPSASSDEPTSSNNSKAYSEVASMQAAKATEAKTFIEKLTVNEEIVDINDEDVDKIKVEKIDRGDHWEYIFKIPVNNPMTIKKGYSTLEEMISDWNNPDIKPGQFVIIADNMSYEYYGEMYVKLNNNEPQQPWQYTDKSGVVRTHPGTPGWWMLANIAAANAVRGPQGYSISSVAIDEYGKVTGTYSNGQPWEATGETFYNWVVVQKQAVTDLVAQTSTLKQQAETARNTARLWAVGPEDTSEGPTKDNNAKTYTSQSAGYAVQSNLAAEASANSAVQAESWAVGTTETREGEETDNAKYYAQQANSQQQAAKAWAVGPTASATAGTDDNNAHYWSDKSKGYKDNAETSAKLSESWAVGQTGVRAGEDTNNSKYWSDQAKEYHDHTASDSNLSSQYARGQKLDGTTVIEGEAGYHDNSLYYKEQTRILKEAADADATATAADRIQTSKDVQSTASYKEQTGLDVLTTNANVTTTNNNVETTALNVHSAQTAQSAAESAQGLAEAAKGLAITAKDEAVSAKNTSVSSAELSREYAEGKKLDDSDVTIGEPGFNNNAKYYANNAKTSATNAGTSEANAADSSELAKKWANFGTVGDVPTSTNNAKYYSEQATIEKNRIANMTVSATRVNPDASDIQPSKSTNPDGSLNIAFKIPQGIQGPKGDIGNGIKQITHISGSHTPGTYDVYRIDFTDVDKQSFEYQVWNGLDGIGSVESVNNVEPIYGNITLNKESGGVALVEYFHIGDSSKSEDIHTLYIDF